MNKNEGCEADEPRQQGPLPSDTAPSSTTSPAPAKNDGKRAPCWYLVKAFAKLSLDSLIPPLWLVVLVVSTILLGWAIYYDGCDGGVAESMVNYSTCKQHADFSQGSRVPCASSDLLQDLLCLLFYSWSGFSTLIIYSPLVCALVFALCVLCMLCELVKDLVVDACKTINETAWASYTEDVERHNDDERINEE
jgi:TRAP-type mannitol/chloroaromatic compound transport system permease large subunit